MLTIQISTKFNENKWNSLIKSVPEGTVYQTTYWANYMKEYVRVDPYYITVNNDNGNIVGALLMFKQARGQSLFFERPMENVFIPLIKKIMPEYSWMYAPLIFDKNNVQQITKFILEQTGAMVKKSLRPRQINIIPPTHGNLNLGIIHNSFIEAGYTANPWATFFVDLKPDIETLWMNLKKTGRKGVKKCEKEGLHVELVKNLDGLLEYYKILKQGRKRLGLKTYSFSNFSVMWEHLHKNNCMEVFIAKYDDQLTDGLGIVHYNGVLSEIAVARSNYAYKNQIYGGDLIKWNIIKWGHENGHRIYDLQGFNPKPKNDKEKGIRQFKEKWGGYLVEYMIYNM